MTYGTLKSNVYGGRSVLVIEEYVELTLNILNVLCIETYGKELVREWLFVILLSNNEAIYLPSCDLRHELSELTKKKKGKACRKKNKGKTPFT